MSDFENAIKKLFTEKVIENKNYTLNDAIIEITNKRKEKYNKKLLLFNENMNNIPLDENNMPKIIHFTCKNKNNIDNPIWIECFKKYKNMYPDYKIIIYDNNDIYNIINTFNKKNIDFVKNITTGAVLADIFRYLILYLRGGYYSDFDCEPVKRINKLSEIQYHGDQNNNLYIYPRNSKLPNNEWDFHENPCNHNGLILRDINKNTYKCLGHKYITNETNIIVGYEFEKTWHKEMIVGNNKNKWTDNNIGICQWFIGSKPQERLFLTCYKKSISNIKNIQLNKNNKDYHYDVINGSGPLFFTKVINKFISEDPSFKNKIAIFPCDYFCCGSFEKVPNTKNKFIQHKFTGTWLK
jgi:mannosyltransferase OCH1-like enzyme